MLACSSLRVLPAGPAAPPADAAAATKPNPKLAPGDVLRLTLQDGKSIGLTLTQVSDSGLEGLNADSAAKMALSWPEIRAVERKEFDAVKTVGLVAIIAVGVYFVVQALLISKLVGSS